MNEEIEKTSRSGADSISHDVVAGQTQAVEIAKENVEEKVQEIENENKNNISSVEPKMNITVDKKGSKNKKEKKNRNTRTTLLILLVILLIVVAIGITYLKIQELKDKYKIEKEIESVFDETVERKQDDDSKYVVHFGDTFDYNDIEVNTISIIDGQQVDDLNSLDYSKVGDQIHYVQISGLKDKVVQESVNNTIKNETINLAATNVNGHLYSSSRVSGNYGNVLSVQIMYPYKVGEKFSNQTKGLNFDLNTGELVPFEKLFVSSAPVKTILYNACMESLAWNIDVEAYYAGEKDANNYQARDMSAVDDYAVEVANLYDIMKDNISYSFNDKYIFIHNFNPSFFNSDSFRTIAVNIGQYSDYYALYKRYLNSSSIYERDCCLNNVFAFVGSTAGQGIGLLDSKVVYNKTDNYIENVMYWPYGTTEFAKQLDIGKIKQVADRDFNNPIINRIKNNTNNRYYISGIVSIGEITQDTSRTYEYQIKQKYALCKGAKYSIMNQISYTELENTSDELFAKVLYAESRIPRSGISNNPIGDLNKEIYKQYTQGISMPVVNIDQSNNGIYYYDSDFNLLFSEKDLPSIDEMVKFIDEYESMHNYGS